MPSPVSKFSVAAADIGVKRSIFDRNNRHLTTMSAGLLYPLLVDEVLPGDTFQLDVSSLLRMSTPIHPVMDNCYLDLYAFFCPSRILWDHYREFMGESPTDPYINPIEYSMPMLIGPYDPETASYGVAPKSVLDYMGVPAGTLPREVNALPVRGFCKIWNEWFRDQNLQNAIDVPTDDTNRVYFRNTNQPNYDADPDNYIVSAALGGYLPPVNKYHDYFTSALLQPQKGNPVPIPLSGFAPVYGTEFLNDVFKVTQHPVKIINEYGDYNNGVVASSEGNMVMSEDNGEYFDRLHFENLSADLSNIAGVYSTINDLRYAFQLEKFLEKDARCGSRYREMLRSHFGVTSPDASLQIPEFLAGKRIPINISQVLQTSATNEVSPQGNTAAYSLTTDTFNGFTKSFSESGYIYVVGCIRTEHTYQNGIEAMWSRKNKFDFYFPEFANISEQPIYVREIFNHIPSSDQPVTYDQFDDIFGFQEAWGSYRYKPNRVSGEFRSTYPQSLDIWHYADDYMEQPVLSDQWIRETRNNIDRTLAVDSSVSDQFICDFYFKMKTTRVMPVYSIPGLADHH